MNERQRQMGENRQDSVGLPPLTDVEKMVAVPKVKGFALENKSWHEFNIQGLAPVSWNHDILDNLVLEAEEKRLLLALVSRHEICNDAFDDFVGGKGVSTLSRRDLVSNSYPLILTAKNRKRNDLATRRLPRSRENTDSRSR